MPTSSITAGAWIVGGRMRHHRTHDHFGTEPDTAVALSSAIGKYPVGMTVAAVLADLALRIVALEGGTHRVFSFTASAYIQPHFRANAVLFKSRSLSFTANAYIENSHPLTANAVFRVPRSGFTFTASAVIV